MQNLKYVTQDSGRPFIVDAVRAAVARYQERNFAPMGHGVPPRCGKSSIIALTAAELSAIGCPMTFVLAPWRFLTQQLTDGEKLRGSFSYYAPEAEIDFSADIVENIRSHLFFNRADKAIKMMVLTNGLAYNNIDKFCDAVHYIVETQGVPPAVVIDEVHLVTEQSPKGWGQMIKRVVDAGAFVIGVTGTPFTTDKRDIPGFMSVVKSSEQSERVQVDMTKVRVGEDGSRFAPKTIISGKKTDYTVSAIDGVNVPWKTAFDKGWLVKMNFTLPDIDVMHKGERKKIRDISLKDYNGDHADWVRDPVVMRTLLVNGLKDLATLSMHAVAAGCPSRPRMLVVTSPDREEDRHKDARKQKSNFQARKAREIISDVLSEDTSLTFGGRQLVVEIATSVDETGAPDQEAAQKIKSFIDGRIDVLIVKAMALVGLDLPECKTLVNLSQYREGALIYQMITRIGTPWGSTKPGATNGERWAASIRGTYIGLADKKHEDVRKTIEEMGGLENEHSKFEAESSKDAGDIALDDIKGPSDSKIIGVSGANLSTESGEEVDVTADELAILYVIRRRYPDSSALSNVAIMRMHKDGAFPIDKAEVDEVVRSRPKANIHNPAEERAELKGKFGKRANNIVSSYISYSKSNQARWRGAVAALQSMAKAKCNVFTDVTTIDDVVVLKSLNAALEESIDEFARAVGRGDL
jgi:superfamily II DNA or RNA helicase